MPTIFVVGCSSTQRTDPARWCTALSVAILLVSPTRALAEDVSHANDAFGSTLALAGDELLIGAPGDNGAAFNGGAVYVFAADDGTFTAEDKLFPAGLSGQEWFGTAMARDSERLLVGGVEPAAWVSPTAPSKRVAWIFRRERGEWVEEARIRHDDDDVLADHFGSAVAISGERAAVLTNYTQIGHSYVDTRIDIFERDADGWKRHARITQEADYYSDYEIALAGDHLLIAEGPTRNVQAYAANGDTWGVKEVPEVDASHLAVISDDPPRVALLGDDRILVIRYDDVWAIEGSIELELAEGYSNHSIAVADDLLVALVSGFGAESPFLQALSYRLKGGVWESFGEPLIFEFEGAWNGTLAVTGARLVVGFPTYDINERDERDGMVAVYNATAEGWSFDQRIVPGPVASGCQIDPRGAGSSGLLFGLLALVYPRRRR